MCSLSNIGRNFFLILLREGRVSIPNHPPLFDFYFPNIKEILQWNITYLTIFIIYFELKHREHRHV